MLIGYARVSTQEQNAVPQIAALKAAGCELIFQETATGSRWERPELHRLLGQLRKGDSGGLEARSSVTFLKRCSGLDGKNPKGRSGISEPNGSH